MSASLIAKTKKAGTSQPFATSNGTSIPSLPKNALNATLSALVEPADPDLPRIPWHDMNLKDLHSYRHAYRLNTPCSQTNPQANLFLANAARKGIFSPSVVATRRKLQRVKKARYETAAAGLKERSSSRLKGAANNAGNISSIDLDDSGRQTKEQLATAVRKHFNAMSVSEGEVVARFTYVVRHIAASTTDTDEDKGFRMRFQP